VEMQACCTAAVPEREVVHATPKSGDMHPTVRDDMKIHLDAEGLLRTRDSVHNFAVRGG
jgi:hypothetical protein